MQIKSGDVVIRTRESQDRMNAGAHADSRYWDIPLCVESVFVSEGRQYAACRAPGSSILPGDRARDPVIAVTDLVHRANEEMIRSPRAPWA